MKSLLYSCLILFSLVGFACKQAENHSNDATKKVQTKEDSAYNAALGVHDEVMPKMGKLMGYQKKAQQRSDSMAALLKTKAIPSAKEFKQRVDSLLFQLKVAEKGMNDWMEGFNPDPKLATTEERTAYFEDQRMKAEKMRLSFFAALDKAKEILGE